MTILNNKLSFFENVTANLVRMLKSIPHNSQMRKSIVANLVQNILDKKMFINEIILSAGLNSRYLYTLKDSDRDLIYQLKYAVNPKKRETWNEEEMNTFKEILDEIMPFMSGRDWRIREWSKEDTWLRYLETMRERYPDYEAMGYTCFWKHVEQTGDRIHFVRVMKNCPICNAMDKREQLLRQLQNGRVPNLSQCFTEHDLRTSKQARLNVDRWNSTLSKINEGEELCVTDFLTIAEERKLEKNPNHIQDVRDAYGYYKSKKESLIENRSVDTAVVVEDFSQYHVAGAFYQSLISCTYTYNSITRGLDSQFRHIFRHNIDKKTNKNDKWFTMSVWVYFFEQRVFGDQIRRFYIVSDGCGKHFKSAEVHLFWFCLFKRYRDRIDYFEYVDLKSNHSNNPSDTGASHGKQTVKYYCIRNKRDEPNDEFDVAGVISTRRGHSADVIGVYSQTNGVEATELDSIQSSHRFVYNLDHSSVTIYSRGFDERDGIQPKQVYVYKVEEIEEMEEVIDNILEHHRTGI